MSEGAPLVPRADRLDPANPRYDAILAAHAEALDRGDDVYRDPATGLLVFTSAALLRRAGCCERGCRHCPYPPSEGADQSRTSTNGR